MPTYCVDPVNGNDANAGDTFAAGHPFKTLKKTFAAGDIVLVAKSVESALAGTLTVTIGSVSVGTTNDLSGSLGQYSFIRINGENRIYMVKACSSSVITLYYPYEGPSSTSGLSGVSLAAAVIASGDMAPTAGNGTYGNLITIKGGINTSNNAQDGFTIVNANNGTYGMGTASPLAMSYYEIQRMGSYYASRLWNMGLTDCILTNCMAFRAVTSFNYNQYWKRCTITDFISEQAKCMPPTLECAITDLRTADDATHGLDLSNGSCLNNMFLRWKNAGYSTKNAMYISQGGESRGNRFYDPVFDVLASGCQMISIGSSGYRIDATFINPTIGSGTLIGAGIYGLTGRVRFQNVNGVPTDNREYGNDLYESGIATPPSLTPDATIYHTAAPSVKVTLQTQAYPLTVRHFIPCAAGVEKTVSVWFRKNASYGSASGTVTLPTMRLRWLTGTSGALTSNVYDVVMADTNNEFVQVSHAVTPGVAGVIIVELIFKSNAAGAIAYYDDLEVA